VVLPQALLGYGSDADAWRVAEAAEEIWDSREYVLSRSVGFPLFELLAAPAVTLGKWYLSNLISVLSGLAVILAFIRLARQGALRHPLLSTAAVAFLPLVLTSSSSTMDYIPALALLTWGYVFAVNRRWMTAAMLIGVACGFRPTSGLWALPLVVYVYMDCRRTKVALGTLAVAVGVGLLAYSPVLLAYGLGPWSMEFEIDPATRVLVTAYNGLKYLGIVQTFLLGLLMMRPLWRELRAGAPDAVVVFHVLNIALCVSLFLVLGDESEYLLPSAPSIVLLADRVLTRATWKIAVAALLLFALVQIDMLGGESGARRLDPAMGAGVVARDIQDRRFKLSTRELAGAMVVSEKTLLMFGDSWIPVTNDAWTVDEQYDLYRQRHGELFLSPRILDETRLGELRDAGFRLFVWRGDKWEYLQDRTVPWLNRVEVIEDLGAFFGGVVRGEALTQ
jgi:hypothetical protein